MNEKMKSPVLGDWSQLNLDWTGSFEAHCVQVHGQSWTALAGWQGMHSLPVLVCGGGLSLFQCLSINQYSQNFGTEGRVEFMLVELNWWAINC